jgi:hypothetical protein
MASDLATPSVEQRCIIKLLVKEVVKPVEIRRMLNAQYGEETLSHAGVYDCCKNVSGGRQEFSNLSNAHVHPTDVRDVNIRRAEERILGNRRITVRDIASNYGIRVGNVATNFNEHHCSR